MSNVHNIACQIICKRSSAFHVLQLHRLNPCPAPRPIRAHLRSCITLMQPPQCFTPLHGGRKEGKINLMHVLSRTDGVCGAYK